MKKNSDHAFLHLLYRPNETCVVWAKQQGFTVHGQITQKVVEKQVVKTTCVVASFMTNTEISEM